MCKVISVVNQKGGVGKTTTTVNVGIGLAREGKKVLLIDADPQGSLTASLGYEEPDDLRITLATIMMDVINEEEISLEDGILHHQENVDLLPANIELSALEVTMGNVMSREMIMKEYIDAIRCRYDYILIDCMPSLGMMTINALVSSDSVLIPVQAAYLPVKGLQQLIKTILTVKKRLNRKLAIEGILLTMVDFRTNYARDIASRVHTTYGSQIEVFDLEDGILHHQENVDLLPANIELSALEVTMGNVMSREMIMKEYIDAIRCRYDYILIDCMPSLGMMTINALVSSDSVLIPVQAAYLPVKGLQQLIKTILTVKKRLNRKLAIEGILLTMVDFRTNYARDIASRVHTTYGSQIEVFENVIPMSVKAAETSAEGKSIYMHCPKGKVAEAYMKLTQEVLNNEK